METLTMESPKILVVEDEGIIAQDIKSCLENLGYTVTDVVYTGQEAIEKAAIFRPDLVLMDIVLKGDKDGIEAANEIRKRFNIPIVYLTAYEDNKTLKRAKLTEPSGYILKPFEERYLRSSIEMALYKHEMENKLKESERWLGTILKSVVDGVIVTDEKSRITFMNPIAEYLTGWSQKDAIGKKLEEVFKIVDEETYEKMDNPVTKVLQDNVIVGLTNHTILISKDGSETAIDDSAAPIRDESGSLIGAVLVFHDISERTIAENALKESEQKFRNLFDNATDAIFVQSKEGDILSVNNEACKLLGYTKHEIYSLKTSDIVSEDFDVQIPLMLKNLKENGSVRMETKYRRKDRTFVDVEISMRAIQLLDEEVIQLFVRDITERKKSQKEISVLAHAIRSISECVSITDLENKLIFVNDAFVRTYGYNREELIGKSIKMINSQKNTAEIQQKILETTLGGGWQGELINRAKDGREFPIYLSTSVIRDESGRPIAVMGVATDITERKRLEEAIKSSERDYKELFENAH
ncbi:MAG: PAS domain S-box protein, partial [Ignavibacteria bacterium]